MVASDTTSTGRAGRLPLTRNPRYARLPTSPVDPVRTAGSDEESGSHMTPRWRKEDSNSRSLYKGSCSKLLLGVSQKNDDEPPTGAEAALETRVAAFEDCGTLTAASASTGAINLLGGEDEAGPSRLSAGE